MNCHLCQDSGYASVAHRIVNGKGVCRDHYNGALVPGRPLNDDINAKVDEAVDAAQEKEKTMHGKIDPEKVRELHAQGMNDGEIARKLGCSGVGVLGVRRKLGLDANRKHAGKSSGAAPRKRTGRVRKLQPAAAKPAAIPTGRQAESNGNSPYAAVIADLTRLRDKFQTAIDSLSLL